MKKEGRVGVCGALCFYLSPGREMGVWRSCGDMLVHVGSQPEIYTEA